jgi:hypothetical protein
MLEMLEFEEVLDTKLELDKLEGDDIELELEAVELDNDELDIELLDPARFDELELEDKDKELDETTTFEL